MNPLPSNSGEKLYSFRGKTFYSNPKTISVLNYALALNRSSERYVLVDEALALLSDSLEGGADTEPQQKSKDGK